MAERGGSGNGQAGRQKGARRLGIGDVSLQAARQLAELVGHPPEGVTSVHRNGEGWTVTVEVLELQRIPNTSDVLASYQVEVGADGSVTDYQRGRRYTRAQTDED